MSAGQTNQPHLQEHGCPHTIRIRLLQERRDRLGSKHRGPPAFGSVPSDLSHPRRIQCWVPEPMPPRVIVGKGIRRIVICIHQFSRVYKSLRSHDQWHGLVLNNLNFHVILIPTRNPSTYYGTPVLPCTRSVWLCNYDYDVSLTEYCCAHTRFIRGGRVVWPHAMFIKLESCWFWKA